MFLASCEAPYRIVETITTDSLGKQVRTINKYYDHETVVAPQASFNVVTSPLLYSYYRPYYYPRVIVPVMPHYVPRPIPRGRH